MSDHLGPDPLSTTRHFVLVLRLVLAPGERQVHGDVLDPETGWSRPFVGLTGLGKVVDRWVTATRQPPPEDDQRTQGTR